MKIIKNLTTQNFNVGTTERIKYITIHYTGNNGDTALANTNYFKSYRGASAHYFVDENSIYQSVEDKNIAWHCGANTYYHKKCRNHNSISVEMCSYINSKGKYDFKSKMVENTIELVKSLMQKYNVPLENIVRHYDVTHKTCPEPYVRSASAWTKFKRNLLEDDEMVEQITVNINGKDYKANRILKEDKNYICIADLKQAGFEVGYNTKTKKPIISNANKELHLIIDDKETSVETINVDGISSLELVTAIFDLVFIVCYFVLFFQFLMRGLELMILQIGLPLACVGLLDNDKGVFKSYLNKFFQTTLAVVVQICLCKLGVGMMMNIGINMNVFWCIACIVLAIKTPRFLSEFMVPTGGGAGVVNNVYHSVRLVGMAKNMIK